MINSSTPLRGIYDQAAALCGLPFVQADETSLSAAPADGAQAAKLLGSCNESGIPVSVTGSGSKQHWLARERPGLRLLTHRFSNVLEHTWQDMTCTVQAGCTWQAMQDALALQGQFVALDPLWPTRATVGGVVAANDSGALRLRFGSLRDLLIGMTVVLADGTISRSGGKVVKNVAGYDLAKLLCGSFGTLALILDCTFRLHSLPRHSATVMATSRDAHALGKLLLRVSDSQLSVQSMQMRGDTAGFSLDIRLSAVPEVLAAQAGVLVKLASELGVRAHTGEDVVWSARTSIHERNGESIVFKASVLPSMIADLVQAITAMDGSAVAQATGLVHAAVPASAANTLLPLRTRLEAGRGSLVLLQIPESVHLDRWGSLPGSLPLMRAVKQQFDPHGTLNPGRFLGNL